MPSRAEQAALQEAAQPNQGVIQPAALATTAQNGYTSKEGFRHLGRPRHDKMLEVARRGC